MLVVAVAQENPLGRVLVLGLSLVVAVGLATQPQLGVVEEVEDLRLGGPREDGSVLEGLWDGREGSDPQLGVGDLLVDVLVVEVGVGALGPVGIVEDGLECVEAAVRV